ncbi:MAG: type II secretion system protein [Rubrivivax sp.]|nr:MAG: type II secretion system protein [Rubrivivax sp.]
MTSSRSSGYSIIELVVVLALLAMLATVAMPLAQTVQQREKERELKRALWALRDGIDAYRRAVDELPPGSFTRTSSGYPPDLDALVTGLPDTRSPGGRRLFLRAIPRDPFAPSDLPAGRTWGLRSYASEAARPQPGEDVYDVHSASGVVALNGQPLSEW